MKITELTHGILTEDEFDPLRLLASHHEWPGSRAAAILCRPPFCRRRKRLRSDNFGRPFKSHRTRWRDAPQVCRSAMKISRQTLPNRFCLKVHFRRILPVPARSGEGLLTEPTR